MADKAKKTTSASKEAKTEAKKEVKTAKVTTAVEKSPKKLKLEPKTDKVEVKTEAKLEAKEQSQEVDLSKVTTKVALPELKEVLRAGLQFGHEAKRWHPNFSKFIFGEKNKIHIIDVSKTLPLLKVAGDFLSVSFAQGPVLFLGTKRQASEIIKEAAVKAGAHYIEHRWAGGLLSNFEQIRKSTDKLNKLEQQFEEGVTGRTKYEVSQMKKEWERLNRLYGGIKKLTALPKAVVVVDPSFEAGAIRECNVLGIPVIAVIDSHTNPDFIDYPIPANDDAINSIKLIVNYLVARLEEIKDTPHRVSHKFKDYTKVEVQIKKQVSGPEIQAQAVKIEAAEPVAQEAKPSRAKKAAAKQKKGADSMTTGGILGRYQEQKETPAKPKK